MRELIAKKMINFGEKLSVRRNDLSWIIPESSEFERSVIRAATPFTSTTPAAQWAFIQAIKHVEKAGIPGDIVECGVWKGGNLIIAAQLKKHLNFAREIWGYDTFAGMTEPNEKDVKPGFGVDAVEKFNKKKKGAVVDWCFIPLEEVQATIKMACDDVGVRLVKGDVRETLTVAEHLPSEISILRLDTDFYESTMVELEVLYPKLHSGGVVIIDDYGVWQGSKTAVHEYFGEDIPWLHYVNRGVRLFIKP